MKAILRNYRQSPRKVRLVANLVRGKSVPEALTLLMHTPKRASQAVSKLISAAAANAGAAPSASREHLVVRQVSVDGGRVLKRFMPAARGRATPIRKKTSHLSVELERKARP